MYEILGILVKNFCRKIDNQSHSLCQWRNHITFSTHDVMHCVTRSHLLCSHKEYHLEKNVESSNILWQLKKAWGTKIGKAQIYMWSGLHWNNLIVPPRNHLDRGLYVMAKSNTKTKISVINDSYVIQKAMFASKK